MTRKEQEILDLYSALSEAQKEIAILEDEVKQTKIQLIAKIPQNETVAGVKHVFVERPSIRYKEALSLIVANFVPKTKAEEVEKILTANTTVSPSSRFILAHVK